MEKEKLNTLKYVVQYAINPDLRVAKKEIFSFIIFSVSRGKVLDVDELRKSIRDTYELELPDLILEQTLEKMEKDRTIQWTEFSPEKKRLAFRLVESSEKKIEYDRIVEKYYSRVDGIRNWFFERLKEYYVGPIDDNCKERLLLEFFVACRMIAWKHAQAIQTRTLGEIEIEWPSFSLERSNMDPQLREAMEKVLREVWTERAGQVVMEFINLTIFWNIFTSMLPYSASTRNFLLEKKNDLQLFLDTNVIVSSVCHYHRCHYVCNKFLDYLRQANISLAYITETEKELARLLEGVRNAIRVLETYPVDTARMAARNIGNPMLIGYFEERYRNWRQYYQDFQKFLSLLKLKTVNTQDLVKGYGLSLDNIRNPSQELVESLMKKLQKMPDAARHDASLLTLVRSIREVYKKEGHRWFVHWLLTLDAGLRDKDKYITTEKGKREWPSCIHVFQIPMIFEPYALAEAVIRDLNSIDDFSVYSSVQAISMVPAATVGESMIDTLREPDTEEELTTRLARYLREMCWDQDIEEDHIRDNTGTDT